MREKFVVYGFGAIVVAATGLVIALLGVGIAFSHWIFPAHATDSETFLRHGGVILMAIALVVAVIFWSKAVQRIMSGTPAPITICPMCGETCSVSGRCLACGETFLGTPESDTPHESN